MHDYDRIPLAGSLVGSNKSASTTSVTLQYIATAFLFLIAMVCIHELIYQLRSILVPFVLSGFIVLAVEPTVSIIHLYLAGVVWPNRWCICCCARASRRQQVGKPGGGGLARERPASQAGAVPPFDPFAPSNASFDDGSELASDGFEERMAAEEGTPLLRRDNVDNAVLSMTVGQVADGIMRAVAAGLVLLGMLLVMLSFATMLVRGALRMRENFEAYRGGVQNMLRWLDALTVTLFGKFGIQSGTAIVKVRSLYNYLLSKTQSGVEVLLDEIVSTVYGGFTTLFVVFLYVLFWLLRPLPISGQAGNLVRSYIYKKTFVSLLLGLWVSLMFYMLRVDLALFFGMVSFFLNYVPEVGSFISICIPVPVILLDGRLPSPVGTAVIAIVGQLFLKMLFNNVLEVKLVERDREMSIHPVWVLLGLNYFGFVWGAIGMLISVPLLAMLKSALLSKVSDPSTSELTVSWSESLLDCLEGRPGRSRRKLAQPISEPGPYLGNGGIAADSNVSKAEGSGEHQRHGGGSGGGGIGIVSGGGGDAVSEEERGGPTFAEQAQKPKKRQEPHPSSFSSGHS
eukprot:TRINITY_DN61362_c0_g1_i1.p1 TRINITY_DN61362_c0_g1~~TRINITY_DN61362_c0_g1_i1.p1  ORF type:complete len:627 (+),score=82.49 TRINITY_DN61362_c0_g1_i1:177-1883(+)